MRIVPSLLEKYAVRAGYEFHTEIDLEDSEIVFRFVAGKYENYSSLAVFLTGEEISDLLKLNDVLTGAERIFNSEDVNKDKSIDDLIYITLAKYIIQMLNAVSNKDNFPEIKALPQHKETYFRRYEPK